MDGSDYATLKHNKESPRYQIAQKIVYSSLEMKCLISTIFIFVFPFQYKISSCISLDACLKESYRQNIESFKFK